MLVFGFQRLQQTWFLLVRHLAFIGRKPPKGYLGWSLIFWQLVILLGDCIRSGPYLTEDRSRQIGQSGASTLYPLLLASDRWPQTGARRTGPGARHEGSVRSSPGDDWGTGLRVLELVVADMAAVAGTPRSPAAHHDGIPAPSEEGLT